MLIETMKVDHDDPKTVHKPILRLQLHGTGCPLEHCNCSPGYWILVSDGNTSLRVQLDKKEANEILNSGGNMVEFQ